MPTCPVCHVTWTQIGNRTGHCSRSGGGCCRTFSSLYAFDAHQRMVDGRSVCADPATLLTKTGEPRFRTRTDSSGAEVWGEPRRDGFDPEAVFKNREPS